MSDIGQLQSQSSELDLDQPNLEDYLPSGSTIHQEPLGKLRLVLLLTFGWIIFLSSFIPVHFLLKGNDNLRRSIEMDGLTKSDELVFVLAATNLPWELDAAMLRCLEKLILVPLPEPEARRAMFDELLPSQPREEQIPYDLLVDQTEGFSGSDIRLLCKETAMQPLRRLMSQLEQRQEVVPEEELPQVGPMPSAHLHAHKYEKFNADYGSQILQ